MRLTETPSSSPAAAHDDHGDAAAAGTAARGGRGGASRAGHGGAPRRAPIPGYTPLHINVDVLREPEYLHFLLCKES